MYYEVSVEGKKPGCSGEGWLEAKGEVGLRGHSLLPQIAVEGHGADPSVETPAVGRPRADSDGLKGQDVAHKRGTGAESGRAPNLPKDIADLSAIDDCDRRTGCCGEGRADLKDPHTVRVFLGV